MRVYVRVDMEGISGIVDIAYMDRSTDLYRSGRRLMTQDANAAIAGCFDAGAEEVWVRDSHGTACNLDTELLDTRVILDKDRSRRTSSLDETFAALVIVGQHAMAGTLNGFLDHTQSSVRWFGYSINGTAVGETGQWATMAGHFGVPLVYLSGDQAACEEAGALIPGIVTTAVKRGVGRNRAEGMHPSLARQAIRRDVARALIAGKFPKPLRWARPLVCRLTCNRTDLADERTARGDVRRVDARTVEKRAPNQLEILL